LIGIHMLAEAYCARLQDDDAWGYRFKAGDTLPGLAADFGAGGIDLQLSVSALLEPDCDNDGLGDDTQDEDTSSCPRCLGEVATVVGTDERDVIRGTASRDVIVGGEGDDKLIGEGGHDLICGGEGHDLITGGSGRDKLKGEQGDDKMRAGKHRDLCTGGAGADDGADCERGSEAA
jgi:Ca2+-binding RTX toxin-like protein